VALHQMIQRLLLIGCGSRCRGHRRLRTSRGAPVADRCRRAGPLDLRSTALSFGNRYRSGFWAIYLLSAVAVLCAVLPLGLGWDDSRHACIRSSASGP